MVGGLSRSICLFLNCKPVVASPPPRPPSGPSPLHRDPAACHWWPIHHGVQPREDSLSLFAGVNDGWDENSSDGRTDILLIITDAHDQNKKKIIEIEKKTSCLSNWCISLVSEVPRVCGSWQTGRLSGSERLVPLGYWWVTWRRAVGGLGWPLPPVDA